jgi:hypothetical protein
VADALQLPPGFRQGLITSITVVLTASLLFFRFVVFEPSSGPWTKWGAGCAILAAVSILMQLYTLWRSLQPEDERVVVYKVTLRWFAFGVILLLCSLAADTVANLVY